jgi:hypothetical protein
LVIADKIAEMAQQKKKEFAMDKFEGVSESEEEESVEE